MRNAGEARTRLIALGLAVVTLAAGAAAAGCGSSKSAAAKPMHLKVMEFNIENGGTGIDFAKVVEAVKLADPDVVCIEEGMGNIPRLAKALGWTHYSVHLQVLSRYPVIDPPSGQWHYVWVEAQPGRVVAVGNVHLPSDPYGPTLTLQGKSLTAVLAQEKSLRMGMLDEALAALKPMVDGGIPTFLAGDFNSPSHLDWTQAAVGTRPQIKYAMPWPESLAVVAAGFKDSYRSVYPDPVKDPGLSWWAARPQEKDYNPAPTDPQDRIDYIYFSGATKATASEVVGEPGKGLRLTVTPWPSDHRAVLSTFEVTPAVPPTFVAVEPQGVTVGQKLTVLFHVAAKTGKRIDVMGATGPAAYAPSKPQDIAGDGAGIRSVTFVTNHQWWPGPYYVVLERTSGRAPVLAPVWVSASGAKPQVTVARPIYRLGRPITVSWRNTAGNRWDWLGIYKAPADVNTDSYLLYLYTKAAVGGSAVFDKAASEGPYGGTWPLPAGKYTVFLLLDDGYTPLASANFTVTK